MTGDMLGHVCQGNVIKLDTLPDGRQCLTMTGVDVYASTARHPNGWPMLRTVCCTAVAEPDPDWLINATAAAVAMVAEHCGPAYTPVWLGRGWSVEIRSGWPLWQMTG